MDITFTRDSVKTNRFNIDGIKETGDKKGIAGYHGGFLNRVIGWISCYILHKSIPVESKNKGIYYLNCKSLENLQKRIGAEPLKDIHNPKDVEAWLQQIKNKSINPQESPIPLTTDVEKQQPLLLPIKNPIAKDSENKLDIERSLKKLVDIRSKDDIRLKHIIGISKSIKDHDQPELNHHLKEFGSMHNLIPLERLACEFFENRQFDELSMMAKGFEHLKDYYSESYYLNNLFNKYKIQPKEEPTQ